MGRGVALRGSLRHRLQANAFQFLRQLFVILPQRTRLVARHLLQQFGLRITPERLATGQQLVEHDAQTEDVAAAIDPMSLATGLFGTHVGRRPGVLRSFADVLFPECQPEINDVRLAVVADQDVARLHIPMDESLLVGVMQGVSDGRDQFGGFPILEPLLLEPRGEVGPLDVLRDDVAGAVLRAADIIHRNDVRDDRDWRRCELRPDRPRHLRASRSAWRAAP